jgi:demethylmenaquinone methyltransferase/2-methoxy-6-polyprenyl-1,4-benzoquinol methylase
MARSALTIDPITAREPLLEAYTTRARLYDKRTMAFHRYRRMIVDALPLRQGDVVIDAGCGTGLCFSMLVEKVGPGGRVIGVDASSDMAAQARERVAREGWSNVDVMEVPVTQARIAVAADAALFCAVHDILQSDAALRTVMGQLRPGAPVAAGGGKWADPWMLALNFQVRALHAPYIRDFRGFDRPWSRLEPLLHDFQVRELAMGTGYVATGRSG